MRRLGGVLAISLLVACGGARPTAPSSSAAPVRVGPGRKVAARDVALSAGTLRLLIRFAEGQEPWAAYVGDQASAFLMAAERYLGVPHERARTRFYGEPPRSRPDQLLIAGEAVVFHDGQWFGGYHERKGERGIFIEYGRVKIGRPALLDHELGHFWFDGLLWLSEGIVSFLPLAMANDGVLSLTDAERRTILRSWGADDDSFPEDLPVQVDFRKVDKAHLLFFYRKTFKVQCILYRELGPTDYRRFAREVASTAARLRGDAEALALLGSIKPTTDFRAQLSGWVLEGAYTTAKSRACKGLALERGRGTDAQASE